MNLLLVHNISKTLRCYTLGASYLYTISLNVWCCVVADGSGPADETFETVGFHSTAPPLKPSVGFEEKAQFGTISDPDLNWFTGLLTPSEPTSSPETIVQVED